MNQVQVPKVALEIRDVEGMMGVVEGSLKGLPWMILVEESRGRPRNGALESLGISADVFEELVVECTQAAQRSENPEEHLAIAMAIWAQGLAAMRGAELIMNQVLESGWDQVEAKALVKLNQALEHPQALKDPKDALLVAEKANRALRRGKGEFATKAGGAFGAQGAGEAGMNLAVAISSESGGTTHRGQMVLSLSPRIREQLQNPMKEINPESGKPESSIQKMEMLSLESARKLADVANTAAPKLEFDSGAPAEGFKFGDINFGSVLDAMKSESGGKSDDESDD